MRQILISEFERILIEKDESINSYFWAATYFA